MKGTALKMGARGFALGMLLLVGGVAQAGQAGGVNMPDSLQVEGRTLALTHMELKKKLFFNIYVWSLYMEEEPTCFKQAVASNSLKRLHFRFLRTITKDQLVGSFREGLRQNPAMREDALNQSLEKLLSSLHDVRKGDDLVLTYLPGSGLHVSGGASGGVHIPGKPFADALFSSWLNTHPIFPP
ncbi:chalcone isomerase family protein [Corallococcus sp. bb12-1]|uniref:chalcone isomerase family protein n=1 Tax=Corallococcus sp. bb12-1 TaxID=2996784 RepID=UPI00226F3184|nr:chalcone isomerase family protein [Corallococcus sp. bb12-1]MCY1044647.1 chalcone isomerase family protein [Corallococcus sp. bb12-1]